MSLKVYTMYNKINEIYYIVLRACGEISRVIHYVYDIATARWTRVDI